MCCALSSAHASDPTVSIVVFDAGVPEDAASVRDLGVFPRIRAVEAMVWPFRLRQAMMASGRWPIVRIQPEERSGAELSISGRILKSDAYTLAIAVRAVDAAGSVWLDKTYATERAERAAVDGLFAAIASDIESQRDALGEAAMRRLSEIAVLRYASVIAPNAFQDYLSVGDDGVVALKRLPAEGDPMLQRIRLVQETEFVVNDVLDERFEALNDEVSDVLDLWQNYRSKNVGYRSENRRRADGDPPTDMTDFESIKRLYDLYKWDRQADQEQDRLAVAFNNEVGPRVARLEQRVAELQVFVDRKYAEWNRILEQLYELETRVEPAS